MSFINSEFERIFALRYSQPEIIKEQTNDLDDLSGLDPYKPSDNFDDDKFKNYLNRKKELRQQIIQDPSRAGRVRSDQKRFKHKLPKMGLEPGDEQVNKYESLGGEVLNMPSYGYKQLVRALHISFELKHPLMIYGLPGVGKSQIVHKTMQSIASALYPDRTFVDFTVSSERDVVGEILANPTKYFVYYDVRASQLDPVLDIRGIPDQLAHLAKLDLDESKKLNDNIQKIGKALGGLEMTQKVQNTLPASGGEASEDAEEYARYLSPAWISAASMPGAAGYIFFDELNMASEEVMNSLYSIAERLVGSRKLSDDIAIGAAGNLDMGDPALKYAFGKRFQSVGLHLDPKGWLEWARSVGIHPTIINYVKTNPEELFYKISGTPDGKGGQPDSVKRAEGSPDPRNFERLSAEIHNAELDFQAKIEAGYDEREAAKEYRLHINDAAIRACGNDWALGYNKFLRYMSVFDIMNIKRWSEGGRQFDFHTDTDKTEIASEKRDKFFAMVQYLADQFRENFDITDAKAIQNATSSKTNTEIFQRLEKEDPHALEVLDAIIVAANRIADPTLGAKIGQHDSPENVAILLGNVNDELGGKYINAVIEARIRYIKEIQPDNPEVNHWMTNTKKILLKALNSRKGLESSI